MRLDRHVHPDGKNKYALIKLRNIPGNPKTAEDLAAAILANPDCVEFGDPESKGEFFVIKVRDAFAPAALDAYANEAADVDIVYANDVRALAARAGNRGKFAKRPD